MKAALAAALLILVAGCGSSSDDKTDDAPKASSSPSATPSTTPSVDANATPKCADVWVAGKTLPEGYEGCIRADGDLEAGISDDCKDGSSLFVYDDKFWALGGDKITGPADVANAPEYQDASEACSG